MKNIETILKDAAVEITPEALAAVDKAVIENYKTIAEFEKQAEKLTAATNDLKTAREDIQKISTKFEGKTAEEWKAELDNKQKEWEEADAAREEAEAEAKTKAEISTRFDTATGAQKYRDELTRSALLLEFTNAVTAEENKGKGDVEILTALTKDKGYFVNPNAPGSIPGAKPDEGGEEPPKMKNFF